MAKGSAFENCPSVPVLIVNMLMLTPNGYVSLCALSPTETFHQS